MNKRMVLTLVVVVGLVVAGLAASWLLRSPSPAAKAPTVVASTAKPLASPEPAKQPASAPGESPVPDASTPPAATPAKPVEAPVLTPETLKNTSWSHEKFRIDLAADGSVVIGGADRAKWKVEGDRLKLYSDTSDEVHYLDIKGDKLFWEGIEIGRTK